MTTEDFWKKNLKVGTMVRRISDSRYFEVVAMKEVKVSGKPEMEYILEAESGGRMPTGSHWLDCYFVLA